MDERDYKAMNEELKKIQPSIELQISNDQLAMIAESEVLKINGMEFISRNKVEKMLVDFANEQLKEKEDQLTKSNEMNERLAESLRKLSSQEHIEQELYIRFIKDAFDILEQYQNSKK